MGRPLFMPGENMPDRAMVKGVIKRDDRSSRKAKEDIHPLFL
jgi:hypothetical protein